MEPMKILPLLLVLAAGASMERTEQPRTRWLKVKRNTDGAPATDDAPVDLHNKEFCVDVSAFKPLEWVEREGESCSTEFVKQCEEKRENVCADVAETVCDVVPYTECTMGMEEQQYSQTELAPKLFVEQTCKTSAKTVPHIKKVPECRNVTKQNCVTLWETDEQGNQVWAGKEGCEPVTWQECKLVDKTVHFRVPDVNCTPKQELWYHVPEPVQLTRMTNTFTCKVKNTTSCWVEPKSKCKYIKWQECREIPVTNCQSKLVHVPEQEKIHRKKCLLPNREEQPRYNADKDPEVPNYQDLESDRLQLRQAKQQQSFRQPQRQQQSFRQPKQFNNIPQQQRFIPSNNNKQSFSG